MGGVIDNTPRPILLMILPATISLWEIDTHIITVPTKYIEFASWSTVFLPCLSHIHKLKRIPTHTPTTPINATSFGSQSFWLPNSSNAFTNTVDIIPATYNNNNNNNNKKTNKQTSLNWWFPNKNNRKVNVHSCVKVYNC